MARMWSVLVNVSWGLEKNVFCHCWMKQSIVVNYNIQLIYGIMSLTMSLLIFCLLDLSINGEGMLKSRIV